MAKAEAAKTLMTADELLTMPDDGVLRELISGELVEMAPASGDHADLNHRLGSRLAVYVDDHRLGRTFSSEGGFILRRSPDTVRCADTSFVSHARLDGVDTTGFVECVPDLVLEVVSRHDRKTAVTRKVLEWLDAGVQVVWVLWPGSRLLQVWRSPDDVVTLGPDDTLTCEDLLPGFALELSKVLS